MRDIDVRVTGFNYTTFHAYTTEVEVDGHTWTLSIRYNTFHQFYERLLAIEKYFTVEFPPKGGLFFSPPPEERQEGLDEFMLGTLAYFDMRDHPKRMGALLDELLEISKHLVVKDEEEERTASEGSFDVIDDFLESGQGDTLQPIVNGDNQAKGNVIVDPEGVKAEGENEVQAQDAVEIDPVELDTKPETVEANEAKQQEHTEDKVLEEVSIMKESVVECKAAKVEKTIEGQQSVTEDNAMEVEVEMQQMKAFFAKVEEKAAALMKEKYTVTHEESIEAVPIQAAIETTGSTTEPVEHNLEPVASIEADHEEEVPDAAIELEVVSISDPKIEEKPVEEDESFSQEESEESDLESCKEDTEAENPVVGWFRRIISFGPPDEKEEQEAVEKQDEEEELVEQETATQAKIEATEAEARTKAEEEARTKAEEEACSKAEEEARTKAEEEAKAKDIEAELLLAAQELNLRLKRYRHPVFFRNFHCDVKASCFFMPQRLSSGILV